MKSSELELKRRGFLSENDYKSITGNGKFDIISNLSNKEAYIRTAAIRKIKTVRESKYLPCLIDLLKREKSLYTKIELCDCLAEFGTESLEYLIPLLGKIGNNQHRQIGNYDLDKKSYPLPRDIVARIIIRIGPAALPYLKAVIKSGNVERISEAVDAAGHITFTYNDHLIENEMIELFRRSKDVLIKWKIIKAFQGFNSPEVIPILNMVVDDNSENEIMINEAKRSLERITKRKKRLSGNSH